MDFGGLREYGCQMNVASPDGAECDLSFLAYLKIQDMILVVL